MKKSKKSAGKDAAAESSSSGLKTWHYALIGLGVAVILLLLWGVAAYNGLVRTDETVNEKWANVQADYQRRIDLIPNLVSTVKASAEFEKGMQTEIVALRAGVAGAKDPKDLEIFGKRIESAINVMFENYPQIRSTENYLSLQDELAGTENRIKQSRAEFNNAVKAYNIRTRTFPTSIIAGMFGFGQKNMFAAEAGAENAPDVAALFGSK